MDEYLVLELLVIKGTERDGLELPEVMGGVSCNEVLYASSHPAIELGIIINSLFVRGGGEVLALLRDRDKHSSYNLLNHICDKAHGDISETMIKVPVQLQGRLLPLRYRVEKEHEIGALDPRDLPLPWNRPSHELRRSFGRRATTDKDRPAFL